MANVTDGSFVGKRVRQTIYYPERGPLCRAVTWIYEGTVTKVRDVAADAKATGYWGWRTYQGEFHVTLSDVTMTPDPQTPMRGVIHKDSVVLLGHEHGWEILP